MFQRINLTASFLVMSALVAAFGTALHGSETDLSFPEHLSTVLLSVFIFIFKIKTMLDDHQHFGEPHMNRGGLRHAGLLLALVSWFFWGLAAWTVFRPKTAAAMMLISIGVSTMWVGVHVIEILLDKTRRSREAAIAVIRQKWVIINVLYMLVLTAFIGLLAIGRLPAVLDPQKPIWLWLLLAILAFDYATSKSWPKLAA
jgi:K+-transporting ATPase A subunit